MTYLAEFLQILRIGILIVFSATTIATADAVDDALLRGDADAARTALETQVAGRKDGQLLRNHLEGIIAMRAGDYAKAAHIFRNIRAVSPGFEPARMQLAIAMERSNQSNTRSAQVMAAPSSKQRPRAKLGAAIGAKRATAAVVASEVSATPATGTLPIIARPVAIRPAPTMRKGGVTFRFALLPSTNLTEGTSAETVLIGGLPFTLDPASRQKAGVGLTFGTTAYYRWDLAKDWRAMLSGSADARLYDTALKPNETEFGLRFDLTHRFRRGTLSFGPRATLLFQNNDETRRRIGLGFSGNYVVQPRLRIGYSAEVLNQTYAGAAFRDGYKATMSIGLDWLATPDTKLSLGLNGVKETAEAVHLAHRDVGLSLGAETKFGSDTTVSVNFFSGRNLYEGNYPVFDVARKDRVTSLTLTFSDRRIEWKGITPQFSVTRRHQDSNIPLQEFWSTDLSLNFAKLF